MSEAKFTKGPWEIDKSYQTMLLITDSLGSAVAEVDSAGFYSGEYDEWTVSPTETQKANASLMKTSPKMYEMLSKLSSMMTDINAHTVANEIESLLAEARGE